MPRRIALPFCLPCSIAAQAASADFEVDPGFAAAQSPSGWRRLYFSSAVADERGVAFARTADGGYVVCLSVPGGDGGAQVGLVRLDANGATVASGFGSDGKVLRDTYFSSVDDMAIDAQGRIVVIGSAPGGGAGDFGVFRFLADGSDDGNFGNGGRVRFGFDVSGTIYDDVPISVLVQADSKIVVAGNTQNMAAQTPFEIGMVRFNVDGSVDSGFGDLADGAGGRRGTRTSFVAGNNAGVAKILRVADDQLLVAGTSTYSATDTDFAARLLTGAGNAMTDEGGAAAATITLPFDIAADDGTLFDRVRDAALADPSTIVLAGTASGTAAAACIVVHAPVGISPPALGEDTSFLGNGVSSYAYRFVAASPYHLEASGVVVDAGRRTLLAGLYEDSTLHSGLVMRVTADGREDWGLVGPFNWRSYSAPTSIGHASGYTYFSRILLDGVQPVLLGSSVDSAQMSSSDFDAVVTRLIVDTIFRNDFELAP